MHIGTALVLLVLKIMRCGFLLTFIDKGFDHIRRIRVLFYILITQSYLQAGMASSGDLFIKALSSIQKYLGKSFTEGLSYSIQIK
jgi:hypothetical protein